MRCRSACRLVPFPGNPPNANRKDRHVMCGLNLLRNLIQVQLAEAIETGTDQNDVLVPLDPIEAVERVIESVEQICLSEAGCTQLVRRAINPPPILRQLHSPSPFIP